jgi:YhcG PDDEXK nuclease domain
MCSAERWSVRTMRGRIDSMLYERTVLSRQPDALITKGQMELYLRWLDKYEREPEEASPLGIILCTGKKSEQIELLELDKSGIHVAEYLTTLPPRAVLIERLEQATRRAQLRVGQRMQGDETP